MTNLNLSDVRIFVCLTPIRMQFSFDTLMGLAQTIFDQDPLSGHLFLFFNRKRDRIKILFWDVDGFCIWYKRLEVGVFNCRWPRKVTKASSWMVANSINCWMDWTCETDADGDGTDESAKFLKRSFHS